ncbi:MAG: hypothetical protein ACOC3V_04235 [bacterium]
MRPAIVNVDLDFFTKPYYQGNYYEIKDWQSKSDFRARARKWMHTEDFISKLPLENKYIRGCVVKEDNQPLFHWNNLIKTKWVEPKQFDVIHFDAHHDMYIWHDIEYYEDKNGLADYHPCESMIAPFRMGWINNLIWIHPDYVDTEPPDLKKLYPNSKIESIQWSDWNWNNHSMKFLSVVTNPQIGIINQGMIHDFQKIIQEW